MRFSPTKAGLWRADEVALPLGGERDVELIFTLKELIGVVRDQQLRDKLLGQRLQPLKRRVCWAMT